MGEWTLNLLNMTSKSIGFESLPSEIIAHIFSYLPISSLYKLEETCRTMRQIVEFNAFS